MDAGERVPGRPNASPLTGSPPRSGEWWLPLVVALETLSLTAPVINLFLHDPGLAAGLGPVHGALYLLAISLTFVQHTSPRARMLSLLPAVGGLLAVIQVRREERAGPVAMSAARRT